MEITLTTWLAIPAIGGLIGYLTNRLAVKMIFRPIRPVRLLGFKIQGVMPRRQAEMAQKVGGVVGDHLLSHEDIARGLADLDFEALLGGLLDRGLQSKIDELRNLPLIGGFLTEDRVEDIRKSMIRSILKRKDELLEEVENHLEQGLDVAALVRDKVAAFPVQKLEALVLQVASRELRAIEVLGGILGVAIGFAQVGLLYVIG